MELRAVETVKQPTHGVATFASDDRCRTPILKPDSIRVLLVEDDHVDARLISLIAASIGKYQVEIVWAASSAEAVAMLKTGRFDICILDYWLGCESALHFLSDLGFRYAAVPVVVLTHFTSAEVRRVCGDLGANHFLSKGELSGASLEQAIESALSAADDNRDRP